MAIVERDPLPRIPLETRQELHDWLADNHAEHRGFWLVQWRSGTGRPAIVYDDIVEECLIFGWIDSTVQRFDEQRSGMRLTPRRPNGIWSALNKQRLARLEAAGLMQPAGIRAVEVAKAAYELALQDQRRSEVRPPMAGVINTRTVDTGQFGAIEASQFQPGTEQTVTFAKAGDYAYYCSLPGDKTKGMIGAIRVLQ